LAINFTYPTSRQLRRINPEKIVNLQRNRPTFALFPVRDYQEWRLEWEQRDNYRGFQQLRGLNGEPSYVKMVGLQRFSQEPGVFGEYMTLDEKQMTTRAGLYTDRGLGDADVGESDGRPVDVSDLVVERQDYLNARETDLIEFCHWAILLNGTFTILGPTGAEFRSTFGIQIVTLSDWTDLVNGTPHADLVGLRLLVRGKSVNFGAGAVARGNAVTISNALLNRNPNDLGGMRVSSGDFRVGTSINLADANRIFTGAGAPILEEYDEGYNRESDGALITWIPDNVLSIVGRRTNGEPLGEYRMVRNVNNPNNAAGRYSKVIDNLDRDVPRKISVHQGHNGGLVLFYPSAIVKGNVGP
jgi:hypothetical protein